MLELAVDERAPPVGRHLEVRVGRDDLVVTHVRLLLEFARSDDTEVA
jgi:hypothetical protein